ncbi:hypothetical protein PGTUg99_027893 [Puccinia graminis f. sp. tritici]|uniref:Uncharacterized protein n=1 Tax=Puccinia graminis f. sp. tritici TaxID=56615 RepID=A0A5B0R9M3_PUCGR|nr:hypothetical protein PGTUg99_027893 [Puccinia graminis f. sp. tritici]
MPGFIQSIKSRLPQSPFSPPKQSVPVLPPVDSAEPVEEAAQPAEQPLAEILPSEALIAPNSSTVALTLTPVTGLSSQQTFDDIEAPAPAASAPAEESATEPESSTQPEVAAPDVEEAPQLSEAEPLAAVSPAVEAEEPVISVPEVAEAVVAPEVPAVETPTETISAQPLSASIPSELPTTSDPALNTEEILSEPATTIENVKPATLKYKKSITRKEPPVYDPAALEEAVATPIVVDDTVAVTPPIIQVDGVAADVEPTKQETTPAVKEVKPKKKRFMMSPLKKSFSPNNSQDGNSTDDSAHAKPKKNQPLAGRFKHVLCQVKSKVKKDKDSDKSPAANTSDNAAPSDDAPSSDNGASSGAPTPSEELTAIDVAATMDAALPSDNAVTA